MVHGVCRASKWGLPKSVILPEVKGKTNIAKARGMVKAVVIKGDSKVENLVSFSVYDTKPVHFLSMDATLLKWERNQKKIYNSSQNRMIEIDVLTTAVQNEYNYGMNEVNIAGQI